MECPVSILGLSPMAKITDMPVELLEIIFLLLRGPVIHFAQVCRLFNAIATRVLYRRVTIHSNNRLHQFSRSVMSRPILGERVRYLSVLINLTEHICLNNHDSPFFAAEAVSRGLSPHSRQTMRAVDMLGLLLFYLPALGTLDTNSLPSFSTITGEIFDASPLPSGLQSVQYLHFSSHHMMRLEFIKPYLILPALDTLSVYSLRERLPRLDILPSSSNVKHIKLYSCDMSTYNLIALLRSSRSLRTFVTHLEHIAFDFDAPSFGDALRECTLTTLEHLDLIYPYETHAVGPLCDFVHLTHVGVSLSILLGIPSGDTIRSLARQLSEILPKSLVSLDVWIDRHWYRKGVEVVEELVKIRGERLMLFTSLTIWRSVSEVSLDKIRSACVAEGVEFTLFTSSVGYWGHN
jgi:hypothetical protein